MCPDHLARTRRWAASLLAIRGELHRLSPRDQDLAQVELLPRLATDLLGTRTWTKFSSHWVYLCGSFTSKAPGASGQPPPGGAATAPFALAHQLLCGSTTDPDSSLVNYLLLLALLSSTCDEEDLCQATRAALVALEFSGLDSVIRFELMSRRKLWESLKGRDVDGQESRERCVAVLVPAEAPGPCPCPVPSPDLHRPALTWLSAALPLPTHP